METQHRTVLSLPAAVTHLRNQLMLCKADVLELNTLQAEFRAKLSAALLPRSSRIMDKENVLADAGTQTCDPLPRRWNSDISLDQDGRSNGKCYSNGDETSIPFCISTEMVPIIRVMPAQKQSALKPKFTNRLDVGNSLSCKRPADNMLLSDLGLTSQAPEFSQSEFNLSSEDHWMSKDGQKNQAGRVRFLSHDDGQAITLGNEDEDLAAGIKELPQSQIFHSGSWATLTQSERDLSELDSCLSLNCQESAKADCIKPFFSSTPNRGLRTKLKQSVSFHALLPSKATQSMPNLPKQNTSSGDCGSRRALALSAKADQSNLEGSTSSKRHSVSNMEQRSHSFTTTGTSTVRRSSVTGDINNGPYVPSSISSLFLGGRVKALHGGHLVVTGTVWYRGRLPGVHEDVVGIELEQVGLGGDGTFQGHRYFRCASGRGLFVPFRKVIMAWPADTK